MYTLLLLSAALLFCEILVRLAMGTPWLEPGHPAEDPLLTLHPTRGYALLPDQDRRWRRQDFDVRVRTNARGMRDGPVREAAASALRIVAAGDSYTFGIGVEDDETWAEQLESMLDQDTGNESTGVLNLGVPGYSAAQIRLSAEEVWPELRPQLVIVGMFASSYWRVRDPYVLKGGTLIRTWKLPWIEVTSSGSRVITRMPEGPLRSADVWLKEHSHLAGALLYAPHALRSLFHSTSEPSDASAIRKAYQPVLDELARLHQFAARRGAKLVVLAVNMQQPDGSYSDLEEIYNDVLRNFCRAQEIPFVDPLPVLKERAQGRPIFRFPTDDHWPPAAHRLVAEMLHGVVRSELGR